MPRPALRWWLAALLAATPGLLFSPPSRADDDDDDDRPATNTPPGYGWSVAWQAARAGGGAPTALLASARSDDAPVRLELLVAHDGSAIERVGLDGVAMTEAALPAPASSLVRRESTTLAGLSGGPGVGDVWSGRGGAWAVALDGAQARAVVGTRKEEVWALTGSPGEPGQAWLLRRGGWSRAGMLPDAVPTVALEHREVLYVGTRPAQAGGRAALLASSRGGFAPRSLSGLGAAPLPGEREEVTALASLGDRLAVAVGVFDAVSGMPLRGQVLLLGERGARELMALQADAPLALCAADGGLWVGTAGGKLLQPGGAEAPGVMPNQGVTCLVAPARGVILAGLRTAAGPVVLRGDRGAVTTPPPPPPPPPTAPAAPTNLVAQAPAANQVSLAWSDNATDETAYRVERAPGGTTNFAAVATLAANARAYTDASVAAATAYTYRVFARNAAGDSSASNLANVTTPPAPPPPATAPAAPSGLTAQAVSPTQVNLAWNDNATDETSYRVERAPGGTTNFVALATLAANSRAYTDSGAAASTAYSYRVFARNAVGDSAASNLANVTTPAAPTAPRAPTGLTAQAPMPTQVTLAWTDNATDETSYRVERAPGGTTNFAALATLAANSRAYTDASVAASTAYSYRVFAVNAVGDSQPSNVANVTTPAATPRRTYLADVKPVLSKYSCAGCHAGRPYRLSIGLADDTADYTSSLKYIDMATPANSAILRRATGSSHPIKFFDVGSPDYNAILEWVQGSAPFN